MSGIARKLVGLTKGAEPSPQGSYDITSATFVQSFALGYGSTTGFCFRPDGTKMFVVEFSTDKIRSYNLSTAWDVSTASYVSGADVSTNATPQSLFWNGDGTRMVCCSRLTGFDEYICSTPYDLTSITSSSFTSLSTPNSLRTMFLFNSNSQLAITQNFNPGPDFLVLNLATADVPSSTATTGLSYDFAPASLESTGLSEDGVTLFGSSRLNNTIYQWVLSTPNDISSYGSPSTKVFSEVSSVSEAVYGKAGLKFYILYDTSVFEYDLDL